MEFSTAGEGQGVSPLLRKLRENFRWIEFKTMYAFRGSETSLEKSMTPITHTFYKTGFGQQNRNHSRYFKEGI